MNSTNGNQSNAIPPMESMMKCMTVVEDGSRIAFACYDEQKNEIVLEESPTSGHDTEAIVQSFMSATRPTLILISSKVASNVPLLNLLTRNPSSSIVDGGGGRQPRPPSQGARNNDASSNSNGQNQNQNQIQMSTSTSLNPNRSIPYQMLKSSAFDLRKSKSLILNKLRVMSLLHRNSNRNMRNPNRNFDPQNSNHRETHQMDIQYQSLGPSSTNAAPPSRYNSLASVVNFDSTSLVKALGALLNYLQSTIFRLEEGSTVTIHSIRYCECSKYMRIDPTTLKALHIFATEHHPLIAKGQGKEKEGYSLFTLLDRTRSKVGKQCLREWMSKPLLDPVEIKKRHDGINLFLKPVFSAPVANLLKSLQLVGAVDKILLRMQKCHSIPMDFIILCRTLSAAVSIVHVLERDFKSQLLASGDGFGPPQDDMLSDSRVERDDNLQNEISFLDRILDRCHISELQDLHERIISIVDQEATIEKKESVVIHYGFHEELDNAKEAFDVLDGTFSSMYD